MGRGRWGVFHRQGGTSLWPYLQGQWEEQKEGIKGGIFTRASGRQRPQLPRTLNGGCPSSSCACVAKHLGVAPSPLASSADSTLGKSTGVFPEGSLRAPESASQTLGTQAGLEWGRRAPIQSVEVEPGLWLVSLGWFPEPGGPGNLPDTGDDKALHRAIARFHLQLHNSLEKFHPLPFLIS